MKKSKFAKEWNIVSKSHDGAGGFAESFVVFGSWFKVLRYLALHGRKFFEIDIWTTRRAVDG